MLTKGKEKISATVTLNLPPALETSAAEMAERLTDKLAMGRIYKSDVLRRAIELGMPLVEKELGKKIQ